MTIVIHRLAAADLADASRFYKAEAGSGLAKRFLAEFERVAKLLELHPQLGTPIQDGRRSQPLTDFPYSIIYQEVDIGIRILVVRHQNRDPAYGSDRS